MNTAPVHGSPSTQKLGWLATFFSVVASVFGVQSWRRFEDDVTRGSPIRYVAAVFALLFVYVMLHIALVDLILKNAGM